MTSHDTHTSNEMNSNLYKQQQKIQNQKEAKKHLVAFALSIIFTILAFYAVAFELPHSFTIPFIFTLGVVQAFFQLYIWMHLKDKGHEFPSLFMYAGILIAFVTVLAFLFLIWWVI